MSDQAYVSGEASEEKTWAVFCHLAAFSGFLGVPLGHIVGPLVVWLVRRDRYPLVDDQGKESLNFQISVIIYTVALFVIGLALLAAPMMGVIARPHEPPFALFGLWGLAALIGITFVVFEFVVVIVAAVNAGRGTPYRYPITIRFIH